MSVRERMPVLRTERLVLRAPEPGDAEAIAVALGDHAVARMLARVPQPYDLQDARDWLARIGESEDDHHFAITVGGPLLGVVSLEHRGSGPHFGYWLARRHWDKGLMTEAAEAVLAWHFARGEAETLEAGVFVDNPASLRIQEKLGFTVTGRSDIFSVGRGAMVAHIDTQVTAEGFRRRLEKAA